MVDIVENRLVGMKSRGVYENPGGALLCMLTKSWNISASIELLCIAKRNYPVSTQTSFMTVCGFSPLREALAAFVDVTQETVTGTVTLKLYKGNIISAGSVSPYSLYSEEFVTFGEDDVYNQQDAEGFINLFGLPLKMRALMLQAKKK